MLHTILSPHLMCGEKGYVAFAKSRQKKCPKALSEYRKKRRRFYSTALSFVKNTFFLALRDFLDLIGDRLRVDPVFTQQLGRFAAFAEHILYADAMDRTAHVLIRQRFAYRVA